MKKYNFNETYLIESFFDDIEDDILDVNTQTSNKLTSHAIKAHLKKVCQTKYVNLTEYPEIVLENDEEKYIKYTKLVNFILEHNSYISEKNYTQCEFKIELFNDTDDIITIDTLKTNKYGKGVFKLHIKDNIITYATLPTNIVYAGLDKVTIHLNYFLDLYRELRFIVNVIDIQSENKIKSLLINLNGSYTIDPEKTSFYNENNNDIFEEFLTKYPLPTIINNGQSIKYTGGAEIQTPIDRDIFTFPDDANIMAAFGNNMRNTYKTNQIQMYYQCIGFNHFVNWSVKNKNVLMPVRSKDNRDTAQDYIINRIKLWLVNHNYAFGNFGYSFTKFDTGLDKQYGKYATWILDIEFKQHNKDAKYDWCYFSFNIKMYLSGKVNIDCTYCSDKL